MMTDRQLRRYFSALSLAAQAQSFISFVRQLRTQESLRTVGRTAAGSFPSAKMRRAIPCDSRGADSLWALALESDPSVLEFYLEPPRTELYFSKPNEAQLDALVAPYFFVLWLDGAGWADCLMEDFLTHVARTNPGRYCHDGPGRWSCPIGEAFARPFGLSYRVLTQSMCRPDVLPNTGNLGQRDIGFVRS